MSLELIKVKLKVSVKSIINVLKNKRYSLFALVIALVFLILIVWLLNLSLLWHLLSSSNLTINDKLSLIFKTAINFLTTGSRWQAMATLLLAIAQGIVIAMLTYIVRTQRKVDSIALGSSTIASIIAIFSVGCVSCGTSIVAPVVSLFFSGAAAGLNDSIHRASIYISLLLVIYALYSVGLTASTYVAHRQQRNDTPSNPSNPPQQT